jgi:hypothetical protein
MVSREISKEQVSKGFHGVYRWLQPMLLVAHLLRMAREGLIDRRNSAGDRRVVYAELTDEGLRLAKRSEAMYREQLRIHLLGALSEAEISQLDVVGQALANAYPRAVNEGRDEIVRTERSPDLPDRRRGARLLQSPVRSGQTASPSPSQSIPPSPRCPGDETSPHPRSRAGGFLAFHI